MASINMETLWQQEIERLEMLKKRKQEEYERKTNFINILTMMADQIEHKKSPTEIAFENHHNAVIKWLDVKIKAWKQIANKNKDKKLIDEINEALDEWLQTSWDYIGQEHIEEDSRNAKDEFEMFKKLLEITPNKKTRRGGKKHRKKNKEKKN